MTTTKFEQLINEIPTKEDFKMKAENTIFLKGYYIAPDFNVKPHTTFAAGCYESSYMVEGVNQITEFTLHFTLNSKLFTYEDEEILLTEDQKERLKHTLDNKCSTTETIEE